MTRALVVHAGNMYGGVERVLETLAATRGLCPDLDLRFALCFEGRVVEALRATGVPVDVIGPVRVTRPHLVVQARGRLAALLRRNPPDVVITQSAWAHAIFAPVVRRFKLPLVMWVHDLLSGGPWLERLAARWPPDLMVCNSAYTESAARIVFPTSPAEIVHGPLTFDDAAEPAGRVRQEQHTPENAVVIAHVGRMVPLKGHRTLIEALGLLPADVAWVCWFVGAPQRPEEVEYERTLRQRAAALGLNDRVRFLGAREDVAAVLADADVYCQPNEAPEAFGLSLVEALRAGLPVVATQVEGARDIVTDACGFFVPVGDVHALADRLRSLLVDSARRIDFGRMGPPRARALCDPATAFARLERAIARVSIGAAA